MVSCTSPIRTSAMSYTIDVILFTSMWQFFSFSSSSESTSEHRDLDTSKLNTQVINEQRRKFPEQTWVDCDACERMPFEDGTFDLVIDKGMSTNALLVSQCVLCSICAVLLSVAVLFVHSSRSECPRCLFVCCCQFAFVQRARARCVAAMTFPYPNRLRAKAADMQAELPSKFARDR